VLGAAANTPVACSVLAVELFGGAALAPAAVACLVARLVSTRRSLYSTQRHDAP
jgi:H+/Cl- antiporter ClcA